MNERMRAALVGLLGSVAVACGGATADDGPTAQGGSPSTTTAALCDGSSAPRLTFTVSGGGQVENYFGFTTPYGYAYFVIDGQCEYWISRSYMIGVRHGSLGAATASDIASRLAYGNYAQFAGQSGQGCADGSTSSLDDGTSALRCTCQCKGTALYENTFAELNKVEAELWDAGTPLTGPVRFLTQEGADPIVRSQPWPLPWDFRAEALPEFDALPSDFSELSGRVISDPRNATALRDLRRGALELTPNASLVALDFEGSPYRLFVRDELPASVVAALKASLARR